MKLTDLQQEEPQHSSPGLQKVLPQQVAFIGTQKGGTLFKDGMQHFSRFNFRKPVSPRLDWYTHIRKRYIPLGSKHSHNMDRAPKSKVPGITQASPADTLRKYGAATIAIDALDVVLAWMVWLKRAVLEFRNEAITPVVNCSTAITNKPDCACAIAKLVSTVE